MQRDEPQMINARLDKPGLAGRGVEPSEQPRHLALEPLRRWRFKVNAPAPDRARDDLHWAVRIVTPIADANLRKSRVTVIKTSEIEGEQVR